MAKKPKIRAIAICLFRYKNRILVHEEMDTVKGSAFARPLGVALILAKPARMPHRARNQRGTGGLS